MDFHPGEEKLHETPFPVLMAAFTGNLGRDSDLAVAPGKPLWTRKIATTIRARAPHGSRATSGVVMAKSKRPHPSAAETTEESGDQGPAPRGARWREAALLAPLVWILSDEIVREMTKDAVRVIVLLGLLQIVGVQLAHTELHHTKEAFELGHEIVAFGNFAMLALKSMLSIGLRATVRGVS